MINVIREAMQNFTDEEILEIKKWANYQVSHSAEYVNEDLEGIGHVYYSALTHHTGVGSLRIIPQRYHGDVEVAEHFTQKNLREAFANLNDANIEMIAEHLNQVHGYQRMMRIHVKNLGHDLFCAIAENIGKEKGCKS